MAIDFADDVPRVTLIFTRGQWAPRFGLKIAELDRASLGKNGGMVSEGLQRGSMGRTLSPNWMLKGVGPEAVTREATVAPSMRST